MVIPLQEIKSREEDRALGERKEKGAGPAAGSFIGKNKDTRGKWRNSLAGGAGHPVKYAGNREEREGENGGGRREGKIRRKKE